MEKKTKGVSKGITIRFPDATLKKLEEESQRQMRPLGNLVNWIVAQHFSQSGSESEAD
jgi:hypothetical protein